VLWDHRHIFNVLLCGLVWRLHCKSGTYSHMFVIFELVYVDYVYCLFIKIEALDKDNFIFAPSVLGGSVRICSA